MLLTQKRKRKTQKATRAPEPVVETLEPTPEITQDPEPAGEPADKPPDTLQEDSAVENDPLPEGWERLNKEGLQDQCGERRLFMGGSKRDLSERLQAWQEKNFPEE